MSKPIYKVLLFIKRNPNMTVEDFQHTYETVHAPYCMKFFDKACVKYIRRYVTFVGAPHADVKELDFDAIAEMWYDNPASAQAAAELVAKHRIPADVLPYESRMFDLPKIRATTVVDYETDHPLDFALSQTDKSSA